MIISGGGTGGHIYPAISIAQEIQRRFPQVEILFVGAKGKMEMQKVPKAGFEIKGLWISGLQRKLTVSNMLFPIKLGLSILRSFSILQKFKPDLVIGVGGFASGPLLYAASLKGLPTLIHEQNSYAGITNKWLSGKVKKICVAYDKMDRFFPKEKLMLTGNPVRKDIHNASEKRDKGIKHFNLDLSLKTILVVGGSLGARTINQSIKQNLDQLKSANVQVLWQTGGAYIDDLKALDGGCIHVYDFIYEMDLAFAVADLVISRAGASTISELSIVGKPAILVPSPNVAEDHQTKNVLALTDKNAALLVKDIDAPEHLVDEALKLLNDEIQQQVYIDNICKLAMPNAVELIVDEALKLIKL